MKKTIIIMMFVIGLVFIIPIKGYSYSTRVYHGNVTVDYSSGWDNPDFSYTVMCDEIGLDVDLTPDTHSYANNIYSNIIFDVVNSDFNPIGKQYIISSELFLHGEEGVNPYSMDTYSGFFDGSNTLRYRYKLNFSNQERSTNRNYCPNIKVKIYLTIVDYLGE